MTKAVFTINECNLLGWYLHLPIMMGSMVADSQAHGAEEVMGSYILIFRHSVCVEWSFDIQSLSLLTMPIPAKLHLLFLPSSESNTQLFEVIGATFRGLNRVSYLYLSAASLGFFFWFGP